MDGSKPLRTVLCASLHLHFESDDPAHTQKCLNGDVVGFVNSNPKCCTR